MSDNHDFCRLYLKMTRADLTTEQRKKLRGAWSYMYRGMGSTTGELHVPNDGFYWHGHADCAYDARAKGIAAWIEQNYPEIA